MSDPVLHQVSMSPLWYSDTNKGLFLLLKISVSRPPLFQAAAVQNCAVNHYRPQLFDSPKYKFNDISKRNKWLVFDHSFNTPSHTLLSFFLMDQCLLNCKLHCRLRLRPKRGRSSVPILVLNALHNIVITGLSWPYFSTYWPKHLKPRAWAGGG